MFTRACSGARCNRPCRSPPRADLLRGSGRSDDAERRGEIDRHVLQEDDVLRSGSFVGTERGVAVRNPRRGTRASAPGYAWPPGRGRFGERHRRPSYENLPENVKLDVETFMEEHFPEQFEDLMRLHEQAPEAFSRKVNRLLPKMLRLMRFEHEDPRTFPSRVVEVRITTRIMALARRIAVDQDAEGDADLPNRLRQLLERRFDLRQKIHRNEVKRLERRLARARERLDRSAADKEEIITRELEEMLARQHEPRRPRPPRERPAPPGERGP